MTHIVVQNLTFIVISNVDIKTVALTYLDMLKRISLEKQNDEFEIAAYWKCTKRPWDKERQSLMMVKPNKVQSTRRVLVAD